MRFAIDTLTFDLADDICHARSAGTLNMSELPSTRADGVGPLLELFRAAPELLSDSRSAWLDVGAYAPLVNNLAQARTWHGGEAGTVQISELVSDELAWPKAIIRIKRAALAAGFSDDHAAKFVAAIGELYGNVIDHSERAGTGTVAYFARKGRFEFVVHDAGIGVLASLRSNPEHSDLRDSGTALERALAEGVSRYEEKGHGYGFRPLLVGLANLAQFVRFRSGDHGRIIFREGTDIRSQTIQLSSSAGLSCSVRCEA